MMSQEEFYSVLRQFAVMLIAAGMMIMVSLLLRMG